VEDWIELGALLQAAAFVVLAVVALRLWRRQGGAPAAQLAASFAALAAATLVFWLLPDTGWQEWAGAGVAVALLVYPVTVAARLSSAGKSLGAVARRRMHMLSAGSAFVATFVLASGTAGVADHSGIALALEVASLTAAVVVLVGLVPPAVLRTAWRRGEEAALHTGELELMKAGTPEEVAAPLLAPIAQMLGGEGAVLADANGHVIAAHGLNDVTAAETAARVQARPMGGPSFHDGVLALPLRSGWLVVHASAYAPLFGGDEIALVERLGLVIDMALERAASTRNDRAAREAVEQAHADIESLLYTVSHDLKSPLLTVLGYIDLLRTEGSLPPGEPTHFVDRMEASALYMQQLIQDLLELSRIGRREATPEDVDLTAVVTDVADELRSRYPSAYVGVGLLPVVTMSAVRARQLVTNLLDNAVLHSGRSDVTVEVGAQRRPDGSARVWVCDDGRGVAAEDRERVFGVFERLDDRPRSESGTGIGLAACRKIVEQCGGSIRLADVQNGACLEIVLPAEVVRWQASPVAVTQ
jgi:signal transduction histidine kinase